MSENVTRPTTVDPLRYVADIEHDGRRADAETMLELMGRVTGWAPRMWGPSIIGYGRYRYRLASGKESESLATGFSPRAANLVVYIVPGYDDLDLELARLGKHRIGKSCLYVKRLADIDLDVLETIVRRGLDSLRQHHDVAGE
ncbi:MAG: DUF1801 domain-containing protein [Acidimicrobiales bacterium]|nr:DUF1801 domain-containing protein [Acidimicrobiales bacterium]MCB9393333.1 DUF1801 domain-containing protein [Acidimicrobiaceae bacterium]